ncbi:MAG: dTMP kinase [Synechococcales cyanobacterium]
MIQPTLQPGRLITFEGGEGAGKTTQVQRLAARLNEWGIPHLCTREPGGTALGMTIREMLLHGDPQRSSWTEVFLFAADRAEHVHSVIQPALAAGQIVLCDRFVDSTLAYQGYGRGLPLEHLLLLNHMATQGLQPHLTLWFDLAPTLGLARARQRCTMDGIETSDLAFHQRLYDGFQTLAKHEPQRWRRIDAQGSPETVAEAVWQAVAPLLSNQNTPDPVV